MADDERRAEIEAVACPRCHAPAGDPCTRAASRGTARYAIGSAGAPLKYPHSERRVAAVRDTRGDDEAAQVVLDRMIDAAARAGAGGVLPAETVRQECLRVTYALGSARSPQGEDHEAGQDFTRWFTDYPATHRLAGQTVEVTPVSRPRDARGDDEAEYHDEHLGEGREFDERCGFCRPELARSPQGEDHEAWRCTDCNCINREDEAFCFRCGAGQPDHPARPTPARDARGDECICAPTTGTDYEPHDPGCPKARVRDAQGDDEKQWACDACEDTGIDRREGIRCGCGARSSQGEDHEVEIGRIVRFLVDAGCEAAAAMVEIEFGRPPVG